MDAVVHPVPLHDQCACRRRSRGKGGYCGNHTKPQGNYLEGDGASRHTEELSRVFRISLECQQYGSESIRFET